ncbi:MAG TPA: hypothetical protein VGI10_15105 [Polyangiaceae bacterium]|jgi:hypothetical protein
MIRRVRASLAFSLSLLALAPAARAQDAAAVPSDNPARPAPADAAAPAAANTPPAAASDAAAPQTAPAVAPPATAPSQSPSDPSSAEPSSAVPRWPDSETECNDWADHPSPAVRALWASKLAERYAVRLMPTVGGVLGYKVEDYGWRIGSRVDVGILSPLWLSGSAYYVSTKGGHSLQLDALTGFNFVSYGTRWIDAGFANLHNTTAVIAWDAHCQLKRREFALVGGVKTLLKGPDDTSLLLAQAGFQHTLRHGNNLSTWSLTGLVTPNAKSYGAQLGIGASGGFIPSPVYLGTTMGGLLGAHKGLWLSLDLGGQLEF